MSTFTIRPGAALDDAQQIEKIVSSIKSDMEALDGVIKANIPAGVETNWSETLLTDWNKYYSADIPESMVEMGYSALNLQKAVEDATKYSREE